jgi:hypothetical protein
MISEVVVALLGNEEKKDGEGESVQHAQVWLSSTLLFMDTCRAQWPASKDKRSRTGSRAASES